MDPPYAVSTQEVNEQLEQLSSAVTENSIIMVERSARSEDITAPEDWQIYLVRNMEKQLFSIWNEDDRRSQSIQAL